MASAALPGERAGRGDWDFVGVDGGGGGGDDGVLGAAADFRGADLAGVDERQALEDEAGARVQVASRCTGPTGGRRWGDIQGLLEHLNESPYRLESQSL